MAERSGALSIRQGNVTWREVGGEIIALDLETSVYFSTNETGALLWHALLDGSTIDGLVAVLRDRFGISDERARTDVEAFVQLVDDHGLLERSSPT